MIIKRVPPRAGILRRRHNQLKHNNYSLSKKTYHGLYVISHAARGGITSAAKMLKAPTRRKAFARFSSGVISDRTTKRKETVIAEPPPKDAKIVENQIALMLKDCQNHNLR